LAVSLGFAGILAWNFAKSYYFKEGLPEFILFR